MKTLAVLFLMICASPALATTYYVTATGSDSNNGKTVSTAWATIQHSASTMKPGDMVLVKQGKYPERVYVTTSGTAAAPITFEADTNSEVQVEGFEIKGANYIQVIGFDITGTSHTAGDTEHMFGILWQGSNGLIQDNYIHDICAEGIMMGWTGNLSDPTVSNNEIVSNRIVRSEMAGLEVDGQYNSVVGNSISDILQFPVGCPSRTGADADGMRAFGTGHLLSHNQITGIAYGTVTNPAPHSDCLQTWGPLSNTIFEANVCTFPAVGGTLSSASGNEAGNIDNSAGAISHVWMSNNVFSTMRQGPSVTSYGGTPLLDFEFINNTMDNVAQEALITKGITSAVFENNIFYNVGVGFGGGDSFLSDNGSSTYTLSNNDFWVTSGSPGTYPQNYTHLNFDPQFIDEPDGYYELGASSALLAQGATVSSITHDIDGTTRPSGLYDIGAFQVCAAPGCGTAATHGTPAGH